MEVVLAYVKLIFTW